MPPGDTQRTERLLPPVGATRPEPYSPPPVIPAGPTDLTLVGHGVSAGTSTPVPQRDRFPHLPGYAIHCELGRGGMGIVYRATQERLSRTVAVKMLLHHESSDVSDIVRFRSEAEAVAAIPHPHVVKVYESGQHDGRSYFAMEYLPGGTLHARLRGRTPFTPDEAAGLVEKLARAVHAAHSIGIVHRDLKPGNVLFDAAGEPRVTDFGLAKRTSQQLTQTRAVMGTPAYMPPEQAAGRAKYVGPPADIYALGVILYECLTGATPFTCDDSLALLNQVIADDPPSIRGKAPGVPRDLELICFKCLEKGPADRYQTASELADDLRRYADREPVSVRPAGLIEKAVKWAKRRPTLAAAYGLGALAAALLLFGGGAAVLAVQAAGARDDANRHWRMTEEARADLQRQAAELEAARATADGHRQTAEDARDALEKKHEEVGQALAGEREAKAALTKEHNELVDAREALERSRYFNNVALAQKEAAAGNFLRAADLLEQCPPARRGWEWWHAYRVTHTDFGCAVTDGRWPFDVAFTGKEMNLITAHANGQVVPFDFADQKGVPRRVGPVGSITRLSADGRRAVAVAPWDKPHDDGVTVWDVASGKRLAAFPSPLSSCTTAELSADGKRVVFQYLAHPARAFEVDTGKALGTLAVPVGQFTRVQLSADGRTAVAVCAAEEFAAAGVEAVVWDVDAGKEMRRVKSECGRVCAAGLSPDGRTAVTASPTGEVRFHPSGGKAVTVKGAHVGEVSAVAFSPDGRRVATAGDDGAVRVWNPATGERLNAFHGHTRQVTCMAFHPNGNRLVSCDSSGGVLVWALDFPPLHAYPLQNLPPKMKVAFTTDRELKRVFAADDASDLGCEWRVGTSPEEPGRLFHLRAPQGSTFTAAALHPDGKQKAVATSRGELFIQTDPTGGPVAVNGLSTGVRLLRYSADGSRLLGTCQDLLRVWDSATGEVLADAPLPNVGAVAALSADGRRVVARSDRRVIHLIEVGVKKQIRLFAPQDVTLLDFTPDGKGLLVGTREWGLSVHPLADFNDGDKLHGGKRYVGHTSPVTSVCYSPDGSRLASGAADGSVRVWDVPSGLEAIGLSAGTGPVREVWFESDGKKLVAFPEVGPPVYFDGSPKHITIRPAQLRK